MQKKRRDVQGNRHAGAVHRMRRRSETEYYNARLSGTDNNNKGHAQADRLTATQLFIMSISIAGYFQATHIERYHFYQCS